MCVPFTEKWVKNKCEDYLKDINIKKNSYKKIRYNIKKICTVNVLKFLKISPPIENIVVLRNYYNKNNLIVCVKPLLGNGKVVFEKYNNNFDVKHVKNSFNVFENYKKERQKDV